VSPSTRREKEKEEEKERREGEKERTFVDHGSGGRGRAHPREGHALDHLLLLYGVPRSRPVFSLARHGERERQRGGKWAHLVLSLSLE